MPYPYPQGLMPQQQPQNWLERGMQNPMTHMGMGLLAASAPRMSYSPEGAMPNYGAGLLGGMQSYQQMQQAQQMQALRQAQIAQQQQRAALEEEKMRMEREAAERDAAARDRIAGLWGDQGADPRQLASAYAQAGDTPPAGVIGQVYPAEQQPSSLLALGRELLPDGTPQEQIDAAIAKQAHLRRAGAARQTVNVGGGGGGLLERTPTPEEAAQAGIAPEDASQYLVTAKGALKPRGEPGKATVDEARAVQFAAQMDDAKNNLATFEADAFAEGDEAEEMWTPGMTEYAAADSLLGIPVKNIVGSDKYKEYNSNARRWAASYIYLVSGATARQEEVDSTVRQYFRMPGDTKDQVRQKIAARRVAERQAKTRGGRFGKTPNVTVEIVGD